jgi:hypothetical protein
MANVPGHLNKTSRPGWLAGGVFVLLNGQVCLWLLWFGLSSDLTYQIIRVASFLIKF